MIQLPKATAVALGLVSAIALAACVQVLDIRDPTPRAEVNACCLTGQGSEGEIRECVDRYVEDNPTPDGGLECIRVSCGFVEIESTSCEDL